MSNWNAGQSTGIGGYGGYGGTGQNKASGTGGTGGLGFGFGGSGAFGNTWNNTTANKMGGFGAKGGKTPTEYQASLKSNPLFTKIWNVRSAYNPKSPSYRFCFVFYNKRQENLEWMRTPDNFNDDDWCKICSEMPDPSHLTPEPVYGFKNLTERHESQKKFVRELQDRLSILQSKIREMSSFYDTEITGKFDEIEKNIRKINQLLIKVVGVREIRNHQISNKLTPEEEKMRKQLEDWNNELDKPKMFKSALEELENKADRMKSQGNSASNKLSRESLDSETKKLLTSALMKNQDAIEYLQKLVHEMKKIIATNEQRINK